MSEAKFVYIIYIRGAQDDVWRGLLDAEFTRQYWAHENVSDWRPGSAWQHRRTDEARTIDIVGNVIESDRPRRLVITWAEPADRDHGDLHSRVTFELETIEDMVRLTVTHEGFAPGSDMLRKITAGWPRVLSSLKSLLETKRPLPTWAQPKPL